MGKIVLALGGNALGNTPKEQLELVKRTSKAIVDIVEQGNDIVIVHGNGPQVGMINTAMETAATQDRKLTGMPYPECGAMSQGYIGYHLQQAVGAELKKRGIEKNVATVITQVVVDISDPAFSDPQKPVGLFYTKEEAERLSASTGQVYKEDSGRGYRKVVASPEPKKIVELGVIKRLSDAGDIVISVGGGGIPIIEAKEGPVGVMAVIDKDKSAAKLAGELEADTLLILTSVERVCLNYGKDNERELDTLTLQEAEDYIRDGQFAPGSMLPKVQACIEFVKNNPTGKAVISSLERAEAAVRGKTGTRIVGGRAK